MKTWISRILISLALVLAGAQAHAFPISITYTGEVVYVEDEAGVYEYEEGDEITGTFYLDTDDLFADLDEFIRSTHVVDGNEFGDEIAHDFFGPDYVEGGEDEIEIWNAGGVIEEAEDFLFALFQLEAIYAEFDPLDLGDMEPEDGPFSIELEDVFGEGVLASYLFACEGEDEDECVEEFSYVEFEFDSLVIASGADVPEPGTLALLGLGLVGVGLRRRKIA